MIRTLLAFLAVSGVAHAGFAFSYSHASSHGSLTINFSVGAYGTAIVGVPVRSYGPFIHARWPTPGNRFYATTDNVWFFNPYDPPSYRTFGLVRLDADGKVTGVSEYPRSGRGFDFDLTILQREAALREAGLGVGAAQDRKARALAIEKGLSALRSARYGEAQLALKDAVWVDPDDGPAQMLYGIALLASSEVANAGKAIRRGLEAMPEFKRDWARLADLVTDRGERERISKDLADRLRASPGDANLVFLSGWLLFSSGEPGKAGEVWKTLADEGLKARLIGMCGE
ncbi:MAG: hypothetical protein HYY18_02065 [Planctomycetes bacterium]|nr:hypothetical protein [Planctomycetota bacterium]